MSDITAPDTGADGYIPQSNCLEILGRREAELLRRRAELSHALAATDGALEELAWFRQTVAGAREAEPATPTAPSGGTATE